MNRLPACWIELKKSFKCAVGSRHWTGSSKKGGKTQRPVQALDRTAHLGREKALGGERIERVKRFREDLEGIGGGEGTMRLGGRPGTRGGKVLSAESLFLWHFSTPGPRRCRGRGKRKFGGEGN